MDLPAANPVGTGTRLNQLRAQIATWHKERVAAMLVGGMILIYILVMTRAQFVKYDTFGMGFDLGMYEQVIWNTAHGRWFATSNFKYTDSHLGADVILMEALVAVPYALFPSTYTLLVLETVAVALGAIPLYLMAKRRLGIAAGLGICFAYLIYVPLHYLNLYEFQPRAFAISLVFLLFYALEIQARRLFLIAAFLLLTTRSDVALLLIMVGVFAVIHRKPREFVLWSIGLGAAWFALAIFVIVPYFNRGGRLQYLEWYSYLGSTPGEILLTLFTRPLFVIQNIVTMPKLSFLAQVFGEVAFLPLLRPDVLLLALPSLALSLLSPMRIQWDIHYQYASMLYAVTFIGTVLAISLLARSRRLTSCLSRERLIHALVALVIATSLLAYVWLGSPVWSQLKKPSLSAAAEDAMALIQQIPPGARVAASNLLGPHVARREGYYFFPPRNEFYTDQALERAEYILVDLNTDGDDPIVGELRASPQWHLLDSRPRYLLFQRVVQ